MKTSSNTRTIREKTAESSKKQKLAAVIVLVSCSLVFVGMLIWLHSEDILGDKNDIFNIYGDQIVEFEKGSIVSINNEEMEINQYAEGAYAGNQELSVIIKSGRYKGETMTVYNYFGPLSGVPLTVGDNVTVTIKTHPSGEHSATVYEFNRIPVIGAFIAVFFLAVILVSGRTGLKSLVGLAFTVICLFSILIPLLLKGAPIIPTTVIMCAYVSLVSFTILGGINRKTVSAFLGALSGMIISMIFGLVVQKFAKIDGLRLEDSEALLQLRYVGATVKIRGLLVAGIIISSLGSVMDEAMNIASALEEIHAADPSMDKRALFRSGMNIGRDTVGTMTNALIMAFLGSDFSLMIFLFARDLTFYHLYSTAFFALETISGLSASIGMVLAVPITDYIATTLISTKATRKK
jgi:uncharacterized membrane protein